MPMPCSLVPLARAAGIIESGPSVRGAVAAWGHDVNLAKALDGVDEAVDADGVLEALHGQGISLGPGGIPLPHSTGQAQDREVMRPPVPHQHLLSLMLSTAAQHRYESLFGTSTCRDKTPLMSAGGPSAGKSLTAPAGLRAAQSAMQSSRRSSSGALALIYLVDPKDVRM